MTTFASSAGVGTTRRDGREADPGIPLEREPHVLKHLAGAQFEDEIIFTFFARSRSSFIGKGQRVMAGKDRS